MVEPSSADAISSWLEVLTSMLALPETQRRAVRDELEDHLRSRVDDLLITGIDEHDAIRKAVSELGETAELAKVVTNAHTQPTRRRRLMQNALITAAIAGMSVGGYTMLTTPNTALPGANAPLVLQAEAPEQDPSAVAYENPTQVYPISWADDGLMITIAETLSESIRRMGFLEGAMIRVVGRSLVVNTNADAYPVIEKVLGDLHSAQSQSDAMDRADREERLSRVRQEFDSTREKLLRVQAQLIEIKREQSVANRFLSVASNWDEQDECYQKLDVLDQRATELQLAREELQTRYEYLNGALIDLEYDSMMDR